MDAAVLAYGCEALLGDSSMQIQWVFTSASLPQADETIEFMLDDRDVPMCGRYSNGVFFSHWAEYEVDRVQSWRTADIYPPEMVLGLTLAGQ
jgi:hypothetical protein